MMYLNRNEQLLIILQELIIVFIVCNCIVCNIVLMYALLTSSYIILHNLLILQRRNMLRLAQITVLLLLVVSVHDLSVTWSYESSIRSGQIDIIQQLTSPTDPTPVLSSPLSAPLVLANTTYSYGLSLMSYQSWMTQSFSFNITLIQMTSTTIKIKMLVLGNTYFSRARAHYIIMEPLANDTNINMRVYFGCFLTPTLLSGNGTQSQPITVQSSAIPNGPNVIIKSFIAGQQLNNSLGVNNQLTTKSEILSNLNIQHTFTVENNNLLKWCCLTTIVADMTPNLANYKVIFQWSSMKLNCNSTMSEIQWVDRYDGGSHLFFGISAFNISMSDTRLLNVQSANISYVPMLFATNVELNSMTYETFMFSQRVCISGNYNPLIYDCVATCPNNTVLLAAQTVCLPCAYPCQTCGPINVCTSCNATNLRNTTIVNSTCVCQDGYVDIGVQLCAPCGKYLNGCQACTSTTVCTKCDNSTYDPPVNGTCHCKSSAYLVTGYCLAYPGCLLAVYMTNGVFCQVCDTANNFNLTSGYTCSCLPGWHVDTTTNKSCTFTCPGIVTPYGHCADGNANNGDGCSSTCDIQDGWVCPYNTTTNGRSYCVKKYDVQLKYLYSERIPQTNSGNIVFSLSPAMSNLAPNTFKNLITTSLPFSSLSYTYDPVASTITISLDYTQDIQNTYQSINMSFTGLSFYADPIYVTFYPTGINAQLIIEKYAKQNMVIGYIALAQCFLAVLIAISAAVVGLKLIGIQLILPIQLIYYSLSSLSHPTSFEFSLHYLQYSTGYNTISPYSYARTYQQNPNLIPLNYQSQYLLASNIMLGLYSGILLFLLAHHIKLRWKERKLEDFLQSGEYKKAVEEKGEEDDSDSQKSQKRQLNQQQQIDKVKRQAKLKNKELQAQQSKMRQSNHRSFKFFSFEVDRVYFIFFILVLNPTIFAFLVMTLNVPVPVFIIAQPLNILICNFMFFLIIGNFVFLNYDQQSNKIIAFTCLKDRYAFAYIGLDVIIIIIIALSLGSNITSYLVAALSILFIVLVIKERPYNNNLLTLENLTALYLQVMLFVSLVIICYLKLAKPTQLICMVMAYIIIGMIFIGEVISIIRLVLKVNFKKAFDDLKNHDADLKKKKKMKKVIEKKLDLLQQTNDRINILPPDSVRNGLYNPQDRMVDWESRNIEEYETIKKKEGERQVASPRNQHIDDDAQSDVKVDQKLNQLELIKKRLRNNLKMKKEQEVLVKKEI